MTFFFFFCLLRLNHIILHHPQWSWAWWWRRFYGKFSGSLALRVSGEDSGEVLVKGRRDTWQSGTCRFSRDAIVEIPGLSPFFLGWVLPLLFALQWEHHTMTWQCQLSRTCPRSSHSLSSDLWWTTVWFAQDCPSFSIESPWSYKTPQSQANQDNWSPYSESNTTASLASTGTPEVALLMSH